MEGVLKGYALHFFILLNEAYRVRAEEQILRVSDFAAAQAEREPRENYLKRLTDLSDAIMPGDNANDYSGLETLKGELKQG